MAGHRVALRAGVVAAMAAGLLTAVAAPAQANHDVRLGGVGNVELRVGGGPQNVQLRVENRGNHPPTEDGVARDVQLTMTVPLADRGVHIASPAQGCNLSNNDTRMDCAIPEIQPGQAWSGVAQIAVQGNSPVQAGETENGTAQVALTGNFNSQTTFNVRVQGPDRPPGVAEVSGVVTNEQTGEPISGAEVFLTDGQGVELRTTTNDSGQYRFAGENIAAGSIGLRASKDGFESFSTTQNVQPGESVTVQLAIRSTATSAPPETSAPATTAPPGTPSLAPVADSDSGGSFFTTVMVVLGIIFVLLGIGAIALLIYRRRKERLEDEGDEGPEGAGGPISGPPGPRPTPGSHGVYRPSETQVMGGAQTQVLGPGGRPVPAVGPQPALANAQTSMMQRPGAGANDQTAMIPRATDPAGPPGPRPPVAGTPPPPRPAAPTYGGTGYEDPRARHGAPPDRYDNPTEMYGGRGQADGYDRTGQPAPYGQRGQAYGSPAAGAAPPAAPTPGSGTYGSPAHGSPAGRPEPAGYGTEGGYRPADGGYRADPAPPDHGRGYGSSSYESGGSYGPDPYTQPAQPAGYDADRYDQPTSSYGGQGYRGSGGYDRPDGYGGSGGYDRSGGYAGQTYGQQQPGHAAPPEQPAGYEGNDYYDESGAPRSRRSEPPERRRLDWLDDS